MHQHKKHIPVLLDAVLQHMNPREGDSYLDLTAGYGGHAQAIVQRTHAPDKAILVDRDPVAQKTLHELFAGKGPKLMQCSYADAATELANAGQQFDLILADLGVSSEHLDNADRGFSFMVDAPLDMRMDTTKGPTASDILNTESVQGLTQILREFGEEPKAQRIANMIVEQRPVSTTHQLASIAKQAWPGHSRTHPATRTFQALRIAVNDELGQLQRLLEVSTRLLSPGGRLGIISFHSLEDRIVKQFLTHHGGDRYDAELKILTRRPAVASANELEFNPRARSAKLRVAAKIKTKKGGLHADTGKK